MYRRNCTTGACWPTATERLLLRAALMPAAPATEAWRQWRPTVDLDRLDQASAALLPLLGRNLTAAGLTTPDDRYFRWLHHRSWSANMRLLTQLAVIVGRFRAAGLDTVLLKGGALACGVYADPGLRPMGDLDVLVRADQAHAAMRLLRQDGWRPVGWAAFCDAPELTVPARHSHAYVGPAGEPLDLHWHVLWEACDQAADAAFWSTTVETHVAGGVEVRVLCRTHQLLQACVHGARWEHPRSLRWAADAMLLLSRQPGTIDWTRLVSTAVALGVVAPLREALGFLRDALDAPVPGETLQRLSAAPVGLAERLRYRVQVEPRGRLAALALLASHQWCLTRRTRRGWPLLGLPRYLGQMYEVRHARQLGRLLAHGMRRRALAG